MKRTKTALFCGILFLITALAAPAAFAAGNAQKLNGAWMADVEATIALARKQPGFSQEKEAHFRESAGKVRITFDVPGKMFSIGLAGQEPQRVPIEILENKDGSVLVRGERLNETYIFQPNGSIRVKDDSLVLKRVK